jgi:2'-hydroxyisoflavone reductase
MPLPAGTPPTPVTRRDFLATSAATAAGLALVSRTFAGGLRAGQPPAPGLAGATPTPMPKKLKLLILGGTHITGPHLVRLALERGHSVTTFNRGKTEKRMGALPDGVERLLGDRDPKIGEGLKALEGDRTWDAVVDTSGMTPRIVQASCDLLGKRCGHYVYISSISAYKPPLPKHSDESAELSPLDPADAADLKKDMSNYGGLKAACERVVEGAFAGRFANIRPTFISGPGDETDRFGYFPIRVSRGGEMLCPGTPEDGPKAPMQFIDSRDLAAWLLYICENKVSGTFNAAGPNPPITFGEVLAISKEVSKANTTFTWVPADFIENTAPPKRGMSIWIPPDGDEAGMATVSIERALKAGLKCRPVRETVKDTLEWWPKEVERRERVGKELVEQAKKEGKEPPKLDPPDMLRAGPTVEEEKALLVAWHEHKKDAKGDAKPG